MSKIPLTLLAVCLISPAAIAGGKIKDLPKQE